MHDSCPPLGDSTAPLAWAHAIVQAWFVARFGTPTEPQERGWPHILAGRDTLISAPTGSGKTLAAFLACLDRLVRKAIAGTLEDRTEVLYVSPLKALGNDIQKNLDGPLAEILQLAASRGLSMPEIRTAVRSGDTLMPARRAMLQRPPHILVTTPESLYILLTAEKSRAMLRSIETVIVDEIHAVADDKRGSHLALSLERLDALVGRPVPRVGLSATQKPIELIGQFLTGTDATSEAISQEPGDPRSRLRSPVIVQVGQTRQPDLAIEVPGSELGPVASNEMWAEIYDRLAELIREHRSTLVFVNTRRLAERVSHHLAGRLGADAIAAHHGSLSRRIRLAAEHRLKTGDLRAIVATASLELGIDIGTVDLVCQIGSPRSIAVAVQRIGRAGHWRGAVPKGRLFATTRDELVECAALALAIRRGDLDTIVVPDAPLDILAQQVVAACAAEDWGEEALFALVRRAFPYRHLSRADFDAVVTMLSEGIAARRGRYGAHLHHDRVNHRLKARRGGRLAAITGGGAIPETALYPVVAEPEGVTVGTVDEDFAVESLSGDIMLLGNTSWRIRRITAGRVLVEDAHGAAPNIPFWNGEAPARTLELSQYVGEVRQQICRLSDEPSPPTKGAAAAAIDWLLEHCGLDLAGAEQAVAYIAAGRAILGDVPSQQTIIAERFFDEGGGMQLVIHAPFGGRINKAWGLALRKRFCRSFNFELQAAANDNGLNISLAEQHSFPLADVFHFLRAASVGRVLEQAVLPAPVFGTRWRWNASRSLALIRFRQGKRVPLHIQRMQSDDLLASVFPDAAACPENLSGEIAIPDHPLVREVMKDVLTEAMDLPGLKGVLNQIADGRIRCLAIDTPVPSVFSHEILNANPFAYLDDAPLEERRARAVEMRRVLPEAVLSEVGHLDPAAIAEVERTAWPDARDADDLHDALQTLIALPERLGTAWTGLFDQLTSCRRAVRAIAGGVTYWVPSERARAFLTIFPSAQFEAQPPDVEVASLTYDQALTSLIQGWMSHSGPRSAGELAAMLGVPEPEVDAALLRLEASGTVLRGTFRGHPTDKIATERRGALGSPPASPTGGVQRATGLEWCDRRVLARIHRMTLGGLRKAIEPVTAADFMRWLLRWQHLAPGTQTAGDRGTLEVLQQLQGFEAPANTWEPNLLARRIAGYNPAVLDGLCLTGAVGWGRLSPHPATTMGGVDGHVSRFPPPERASGDPRPRRVVPTSVAPVTFFIRDDDEWMTPQRGANGDAETAGLSPNGCDVLTYLRHAGASFFPDVVRGTGRLKSEVETALWELVAAGLVTADGFDSLRALIDPRRRAGHGSGRAMRPRHSTGRWCLLYPQHATELAENDRGYAAQGLEVPARPTADAADRGKGATAWMLLRRYGVVFRELLARETILPKWRELLIAFRRLEDRGEIRGGRFVSGFIGEQFALPLAVESLRAARHLKPSGEVVTIAASDPLNLVGIILPGDRIPAVSGRLVTLRDGVPVETTAL